MQFEQKQHFPVRVNVIKESYDDILKRFLVTVFARHPKQGWWRDKNRYSWRNDRYSWRNDNPSRKLNITQKQLWAPFGFISKQKHEGYPGRNSADNGCISLMSNQCLLPNKAADYQLKSRQELYYTTSISVSYTHLTLPTKLSV